MALTTLTAVAQPKLSSNNIDEVLAAMTLEEKATLLVGSGGGSMLATTIVGAGDPLVPGAAGTTVAIPRLGIPMTVLSDGPAGVRISPTRKNSSKTYYATGFPVGTVLASSWNTKLVYDVTSAMGNEAKEYGVDVLLAPGMNIMRNPLCGRNFEYFSEDPLLSGKIAAAYVNGIQSNGVGVSAKHFAANDQETNRDKADSRLNQRALREIYLRGFETMVKESSPWTVMSSYNKINGTYSQQNKDLLTTVLRDEWGFKGIVMTDWGNKEGTVNAVKAGNDLMEPGDKTEKQRIIDAVNNGTLSQAELDRCVRRVLKFIVKTPRFHQYKYSDAPDLKAHAALVRKAAAEGMVLLKNDDNTLPLKNVKQVALFGVTSYDMIAGGTGSGNVNKAYVRNLTEGFADDGVKVDETTKDWYTKYVDFQKCDMRLDKTRTLARLLSGGRIPEAKIRRGLPEIAVADNDAAIITLGRNAGEGADRKNESGDWTLTGDEMEMLNMVAETYHAAGKKVIVVLNVGGVVETASWKHIPDAILLAWTPGQEVGCSVADVLTGKAYPSGKLPMTFPVSYFDVPSSKNFPYNYEAKSEEQKKLDALFALLAGKMPAQDKNVDFANYEEGIWVGYRYFQTAGKPVSYPFGYGLSYTQFSYSKPTVKVSGDGTVKATITVTNTGKHVGKEAVQLYITAPDGGLVKPAMELKAFAKTRELKPGEHETLTMTVDAYTLASFNEAKSQWEQAAGNYTASFGASAADIRNKASFSEPKARTWKVNNVLKPQQEIKEITVK